MKKAVLIASFLCLTECSFAMNSNHQMNSECNKDSALNFKEHKFWAACFNTRGCRVEYADFLDIDDGDEKVSPPPPQDLLKKMRGVRVGIKNFPQPAQITWRSLDGKENSASIDMARIFANECVMHEVPSEVIARDVRMGMPSIILIVNDRDISVYMKTLVPIRSKSNPKFPNAAVVWQTVLAHREAV